MRVSHNLAPQEQENFSTCCCGEVDSKPVFEDREECVENSQNKINLIIMKKFLLSIFAVMLAVFSVQAEEVTFVASGASSSATNKVTLSGNLPSGNSDYVDFSMTKVNSSTSNVNSGLLRWYKNDIVNLTPKNGVKITKVVITMGGGSKYMLNVSPNVGSSSISNGVVTWTGETSETLKLTASEGQVRFSTLVVIYTTTGEDGGDEVVKAVIPTLPEPCYFEGSKTITITAEEGATVYYSIDNENFNQYTEQFVIDATTTVTAYAQIGEDEATRSSNVSATYTKVVSIAQAKEAYDNAGGETNVAIDLTDAVVTVNSGKYMFIQDSESGINVYNSAATYPVGTKFTSGLLVGSSAVYNGMHQIAAGAKFEDVETTTADITPIVVTVAQLNEDYAAYEGRYVKLEGVALSGTTITQGDETYTLYNRFGITLENANLCDIEGVPACFGTTLQIFPTKIIPAAAVALPEVSVASGTTIEQGAEITITPAIDNVVTYSVNGAAAVEIDGETIIVANEIGEMTLVVTSTYGGETLTETYTYTVVAPIEKITASLTRTEIEQTEVNPSYSESAVVESACGSWTGYMAINNDHNLQLNNKNKYHIQSPVFPGKILSVSVTFAENTSSSRGFVVMPSTFVGNSASSATDGCLAAASYAGTESPMSTAILSGDDVTSFKIYATGGAIYISNITVVYEKPSDFQLSVSEAGWATLYLGLDASIPAGVKCYTIAEDAVNAEYVTLSQFEGNVLPAHTAVIVEANKGVYTFEYADNYSGLLSGNLLKGSVTDEYVAGDAYVLGNVNGIGLYKAVLNKDEAGEVGTTHFKNNANKAYLPASVASGAASYSFRFGEGTTGINEVKGENGNVKAIFDLTGRRVENPSNGIYIINGVKTLVK